MAKLYAVISPEANWAYLFTTCVSDLYHMVDDRESAWGPEREELDEAIKEIVQKVLPILYIAALTNTDPHVISEVKAMYKEVQQLTGLVVPEQNEDAAKALVTEVRFDDDPRTR